MIKKMLLSIKHFFDNWALKTKRVNFEKGAYVKKPYVIDGGQYIHLGENVSISAYSKWSCFDNYAGKEYTPSIDIGKNVFANRFLTVLSADKLIIGNNTFLGSYVSITNENHGIIPDEICYGQQPLTTNEVIIGDNCWIGDHTTILPGVIIGSYSIIGAGSVVTKNIPEYSMAVGVPAKVIKKWNFALKKWEKIGGE